MCTDHLRSASATFTPAIHRVPLRRPHRWSRRSLLFNTGIGTAGLAILAACSGSDESAGVPAETGAPTEPDASAVPTSEADRPAVTTTGSDGAPATTEPADEGAALELAWVELGFVSAYVLVRGNEAAVVDTGIAGSGSAIADALTVLGLVPADVRHIVLTHDHGDHIGGLGELEQAMSNATVSAHPEDIAAVQTTLDLQEVNDGDEVFGLGVIHTPGHTPGSISVFDTDTGLLVAGDAINGDGAGGLLGPNESFTADMGTANASVGKLAALMPTTAAFGHGGAPITEDVPGKLDALVAG